MKINFFLSRAVAYHCRFCPPKTLRAIVNRFNTLCEEFAVFKEEFDENGQRPTWPYWDLFINYWNVVNERHNAKDV